MIEMDIEMGQEETVTAKIGNQSFRLTGHIVYFVSLLAVVGFFLVYLERRDRTEYAAVERLDTQRREVSTQRIDQCHALQDAATQVMGRNADANIILAQSLTNWGESLGRIEVIATRNAETLYEILVNTRNQTNTRDAR